MSRYIDADALIKDIENDCPEVVYYTKRDAIDCIQSQPTADVVEVVRCKDCMYWTGKDYDGCCIKNGLATRYANDYCSYGERREECKT